METIRLQAEREGDVARAAEMLRAGGLVAFATETVYGLGADALNASAVARIFEAKGRPAWDPLIVHLAEVEWLSSVARVSAGLEERVRWLTGACWPGPLTMLLPRVKGIPDAVTAGRSLVGVRVPAHPVARELIRRAGIPVAAPSANRFGHTSPVTAEHVLEDLGGRICAVLDGGRCAVGVESTVVDPATEPMTVYRPGGVSLERLAAVAGVEARLYEAPERMDVEPEALPSPGVGMRHYAPRARVRLVEEVARLGQVAAAEGRGVGVLLPAGLMGEELPEGMVVEPWGEWERAETLAAGLFAGLRALDGRGVRVIVAPLPEAGGMGDAVRDRLRKAARMQ